MSVPTKVGRYPVVREIGRGGMGTVYEATDPDLDRRIALKVLPAGVAEDSERLRRFEREARTLAAIAHPNIVTIFSVERDDTGPFLTMELVEGETLDRLIQRGGLAVEQALDIVLPICEALRVAHERGIVHRDLKPQNVMVTRDNAVKLLDFGLAKVNEEVEWTQENLTRDQGVLGTPSYMSPEQARGGAIDHRTDLWSLGVLLYELLSGAKPFDGASAVARLHAVLHETPRRLREHRHDLPPALEQTVQRCLEKDPARRPTSADELSRHLREGTTGTAEPRPSDLTIAVLPFETLGSEETTVFADGLHSDLLTRLTKLSELRVISRTSVRNYRATSKTIQEIARELDVRWVVEGESQQIADRVQVNVSLVEARHDRQAWAERYFRELSAENVFQIQSEIAEGIAEELALRLTPDERQRLKQAPTQNLSAFQLYTQGRAALDQRTESGIRGGLEFFRQATRTDPDYALAWAGLADAVALLRWYQLEPPPDCPDPVSAARCALEIDPDLGEAWCSLGIHHCNQLEGPQALAALERAVELAPGHYESQIWLGWLRLCIGHTAEALAPAQRSVELNPLGPACRVYLAEIHLAMGDIERALSEAARAREIEPQFGVGHYLEGLALEHAGRHEEAAERFEEALELATPDGRPSRAEVLSGLAVSRLRSGETERALEVASQIDEQAHPFSAGLVLAARGETDEALEAFLRAQRWAPFTVGQIRGMFPEVLRSVRRDARFSEVLRRVNRSWGLNPDGSLPSDSDETIEVVRRR